MKLSRRQFQLLLSGAIMPTPSRIAWAQSYPTRPVRLIVGFAAGGPNDIIARIVAQWLSDRLGGQFIVENRTGAGGNIGAEAAIRATPDGYTFLVVGASNAINPSLYAKLNFDPVRDLVPVVGIMASPNVMEVHPSLPAKTVPEFIAYAKSNPGKMSSGIGSNQHMSGELFKLLAGVDLVHVPYRGAGPALIDLVGGQVQMMIDSIPSSIEYIRAGKLRALAVSSPERLEMLPHVPPLADSVPGYEAAGLTGLYAPKNTPVGIIEIVNKEINAGLKDPAMRARLTGLGGVLLPGSPADFGNFFEHEIEKWRKVVEFSGAKAE
jgi:tripartite-type tricarboxylate transporter receptor subunit TctC